MKIKTEREVTLAEVRDILEAKEKKYTAEERELLYEQKRSLDHARRYSKLNLKDTLELKEKLGEFELAEDQITKICDFLPEDVDTIRAIFAKNRFKYNEEDIGKILDLIAQYR